MAKITGDITTLKETRDLLTEMKVKLTEIEKGHQKVSDIQKKNLQDYSKILEKTLQSNKNINQSIADRASLIKKLTSGELTLEDIAEQRAEVLKTIANLHHRTGPKRRNELNTQLKMLDSQEHQLKTQMKVDEAFGMADEVLGGSLAKSKDMLAQFKKIALSARGMAAGGFLLMSKLISFMYGKLEEFSAIVDNVGQEFGVMGAQDLATPIAEATQEAIILGRNVDELVGITKELSTNFGISAVQATKLMTPILDSSVAMGLSAQEGAQLYGTLIKIGGLTQSQAENLAESTYQLARANDINPAAVMNQLAGNTEAFALFAEEGGNNIALAAVNAVKLGTNLSTVVGMAEGLLDFQSSLNQEIETGILLGKNINLQKARELALDNKLSDAVGEVLKQVGSEAEFLQMNFFQRKAIASLLNTDVATMAKMLKNQEGLVTQSQNFADLMGTDALSSLTSILNRIKSIGAQIMAKLAPHLDAMVSRWEDWLARGGWDKITASVDKIGGWLVWMANHPGIMMALTGALGGFALGGAPGALAGLIMGGGVGMAMANGGSFVTRGPTPIMTGDNPGGRELVSAVPLTGGGGGGIKLDTAPIAREISTLKGELAQLRGEMKTYLGFGGTAARETGKQTIRSLETFESMT